MAANQKLLDELRVEPGSKPRLDERDPGARVGAADKTEGVERIAKLIERLGLLHTRLYAEAKRSVLLVLQGMDASGKDGTIRTVFTGVNPQGCRVQSFKVPTVSELAHDYLWRIHNVCPARGEIVIFNRSHYEDVVAVRVRKLAPKNVWERRYDQICAFERMLADEGTTVVKVFLHLSRDEQREAAPGAARRSREALEVPARRPRRPCALGRLQHRLPGRAAQDVDRLGSVVRRSRRPQLVAQPGRRRDPRRRPGAARPAAARAGPGDRRRQDRLTLRSEPRASAARATRATAGRRRERPVRAPRRRA